MNETTWKLNEMKETKCVENVKNANYISKRL